MCRRSGHRIRECCLAASPALACLACACAALPPSSSLSCSLPTASPLTHTHTAPLLLSRSFCSAAQLPACALTAGAGSAHVEARVQRRRAACVVRGRARHVLRLGPQAEDADDVASRGGALRLLLLLLLLLLLRLLLLRLLLLVTLPSPPACARDRQLTHPRAAAAAFVLPPARCGMIIFPSTS